MPIIVRQYGNVTEITEFEKEPKGRRISEEEKELRKKIEENSSEICVYTPRVWDHVHGSRRPSNIRRTREILLRRVSTALEAFGDPLLVTLTFAGDASDAAFANYSLRRFQVRLRAKFPDAQAAFVPELSPRGRIHFHGLVFNVPLSLGDRKAGRRTVALGSERRTRTLAHLWGEGYVDALQTDGSGRLATYLTKYLTKACEDALFNGMRMLRITRGFPKERVYRGEIAEQIASEYASREPDRVWPKEGPWDSPYVGKISKKTFYS